MAIPNVKRFRPFCPTCNENFTLMAVLPNQANVDAFLTDAVARHDHKAFMDAKAAMKPTGRINRPGRAPWPPRYRTIIPHALDEG